MWDNKGKLNECKECHRSSVRHVGKGFCEACYSRDLYHRSAKRRLQLKNATYTWMKNNPEKTREIMRRANKKRKDGLTNSK